MPSAQQRQDPDDTTFADPLAKRGRHLTRIVDMFWSASEVVTLGKRLHRMSDDDQIAFRASASAEQKRTLQLLDTLDDLERDLVERMSRSATVTRMAKDRLGKGQSNGKSKDMRKVTEDVVKWRAWKSPLPAKEGRGLNHIECAFLLSPPDKVDWEDLDARTQFIAFGNPPMDPSLWPRFFWPEKGYNPDNRSDGLLQGELLIKAGTSILFSRLAANAPSTMQMSGARGNKKRRNPTGIAKSYELTSVTRPFIAYVAVVVRHSLTADSPFSDTCGGFNYIEFYNQVREFLENPKFQNRSARLVDWWNKQLFSGYQFGNQAGPTRLRETGTLAALEAEPDEAPEEEGERSADTP